MTVALSSEHTELKVWVLDRGSPVQLVQSPDGSTARPALADETDLSAAGGCGWMICSDANVTIDWNGGDRLRDLVITINESETYSSTPQSYFGCGVVTWHIPCVFETPPGYDLWVRGPSNWLKDGIQALEATVKADARSAEISMNWRFTRSPHTVRFEIGEPIGMITPVKRGYLERVRSTFAPAQELELPAAGRDDPLTADRPPRVGPVEWRAGVAMPFGALFGDVDETGWA